MAQYHVYLQKSIKSWSPAAAKLGLDSPNSVIVGTTSCSLVACSFARLH
jgi:hypothetical protein